MLYASGMYELRISIRLPPDLCAFGFSPPLEEVRISFLIFLLFVYLIV